MSGQKKKENREKLRGWKTINKKYYKVFLFLVDLFTLFLKCQVAPLHLWPHRCWCHDRNGPPFLIIINCDVGMSPYIF